MVSNKIAMGLVAALMLSTTAIAQNAGAGVNAGGGVNVDAGAAGGVNANAAGNVNAGANMNSDLSFGSLISSLNANSTVDLDAYTDETKIRIVKVSSLKAQDNDNAQALDNALEKSSSARTTLTTNLEANATIKAKLESENIDTADIVSVTDANGTLVIYVDDRA